jgi:hypothetical protein
MALYLGNVLANFDSGVQLDLRVKLAIEFLKAGNADGPQAYAAHDDQLQLVQLTAAEKASYCLDLATALVAESEKRGLIQDFPEDDGLSGPLRVHLRRAIRAQVYQQQMASRIAAEESPVVQGIDRKRSVIEN